MRLVRDSLLAARSKERATDVVGRLALTRQAQSLIGRLPLASRPSLQFVHCTTTVRASSARFERPRVGAQ
jgi:hypothetical protein